ncbi:MAG: hypothetical protein LUE31_07985, partial [Lachnospiraceae bacterium]|nr:hypothetical protein [Lachnospiraceae bacterium]
YGWKSWGHSYRYHYLVSAYTDNVKIYLDSKDHLFTELSWDDQPAEIDGTKALHKQSDWCYLRTDSKKFSLIFETAYGDEVLPNSDAHYRQEITLKPPVFNREMAKKVLRKREDGILAIPDGFVCPPRSKRLNG